MLKNLKVFKQGYRFELFYTRALSCRALKQQDSRRAQFGVVQISMILIKFQILALDEFCK